jgi:hypothetical protein
MESFDLLFAQVNDMSLIQQQIKKDLTTTREDQQKIAKQVQANGQAVASLTICQMENEALYDRSDDVLVIFDEEE